MDHPGPSFTGVDNSSPVTAGDLRRFVEIIEARKAEIAAEQKETYAEAKGRGTEPMHPPHPSTAQDPVADLRRTERRRVAMARYGLWYDRVRRRELAHHAEHALNAAVRVAAQQLLDEFDAAAPPAPLPDATRGSADA